ncbi:hypothetical protein BG004_002230 [Podila humilis]|nr:hypothetical protein BG004_002230 [Podila humilis]
MTVDDLKNLIKSERSSDLGDSIALWSVLIPIKDDDGVTPILLDNVPDKRKLGPTNNVSILGATLPEDTIHVIVQRSHPGFQHEAYSTPRPSVAKKREREEFAERSLFEEVHRGISAGSSFVVHGPCQSGKTSFLYALRSQLERTLDDASVVYFTMSDLIIPSDTVEEMAILDLISRFWSFRVLRKTLSWDDLTATLQSLSFSSKHRYYVLVDDFQWIFGSSAFRRAAKLFFRNLSSKIAIFYVAVGTYQLRELLLIDEPSELPFNKAHFMRMPPFDLREMSKIFDMYKNCDPDGISCQIQVRIIDESGGHPASFMHLLQLAMWYDPDDGSWSRLLQENIQSFLDGTQSKISNLLLRENTESFLDGTPSKIRENLKSMTKEQRALVRNLTTSGMSDIEFIDGDEVTRQLLNIGDSSIYEWDYLAYVYHYVWPQPKNRLSREEIGDPIKVLQLGLQCISPSMIIDPLVRTKVRLRENGTQLALFSALGGLLPLTMKCLFERRAEDKGRIDLMVTEDDRTVFGYEMTANGTSPADFKSDIDQASKYVSLNNIPIFIVNFHLEGHSTPVSLLQTPDNVAVINVKHTPDGQEFIVNTSDQV